MLSVLNICLPYNFYWITYWYRKEKEHVNYSGGGGAEVQTACRLLTSIPMWWEEEVKSYQ